MGQSITMKTVSHSQLSTWQRCRLKWSYYYQRRIELPTQSPPLTSGKAIHTALGEVLGGNIELEDLAPIAGAALWHELEGRDEDDIEKNHGKYLPGVLRALSRVPEWVYAYSDWRVEEEVSHTYGCEDHKSSPDSDCPDCFTFHGFIDLYRVTDTHIELVEIKSSSKELNPLNLMLFNPQHRYYAILLRYMYPDLPIFVRYVCVSTAAKTKKEVIDHEPWLMKNSVLDKAEELMINSAREVGELPIVPTYNELCDWCDYKKICTATVAGLPGGEQAVIGEYYVERE